MSDEGKELETALAETALPREADEPPLKVDPNNLSRNIHHHDLHPHPEMLEESKGLLETSKTKMEGNLVVSKEQLVLGIEGKDPSKLDFTEQSQAFIPFTMSKVEPHTSLAIATNIVTDFFARGDLNPLFRLQGQHQDARLGRNQRKEPCEIWIGNGDRTTPPQRVFSILVSDVENENYKKTAQGGREEDVRLVVVCYDLLDLLDAEKENKNKLDADHPNYELIPNIAVDNKYQMDPHILRKYGLDFAYFSPKDSQVIRLHNENFVEIVTARQSIEMNVVASLIKDVLTPIFSYLLQSVGGLFEAIFGDSFIGQLGKAVGKSLTVAFAAVKSTVGYIASSIGKLVSTAVQVSPTVLWVLKKIYSSGVFLAKFIWNNPVFVNAAIFILNAVKIVLCVWWQGPKVGIETLSSWLERQ